MQYDSDTDFFLNTNKRKRNKFIFDEDPNEKPKDAVPFLVVTTQATHPQILNFLRI